ncbi:hypothetical protein [Paenibacillus crassostreae]|uniref:Uncharacterized protein n=1 Tax=Paenibacillus crassostreae TaxID=1763538 RepID=A0A167AJB9_9BACL|nr:hypothetical protein [Paenibacillus crassostreae]AOZ92381.1 hypothetical protein LPB68_09155 [Paenibacillus crassostreae]OAB71096.1 hypothetical protein PNBC_21305 [Paenibacillus crassostreae]
MSALSFFQPLWLTTYSAILIWMLGYEFDSFMTIALFLIISSVSFGLFILGLAFWIGFGALPIIILLMFFGATLLQLAPEMMPFRDVLNLR